MSLVMKVLHADVVRLSASSGADEDLTGLLFMVMRNGMTTSVRDLSRTQVDSEEFFRQMRRVVANIRPAFVGYANLCDPDDPKDEREEIRIFVESERMACAFGSAVFDRGVGDGKVPGELKTEFMDQGDVVRSDVGGFFAHLWEGAEPSTARLH